MSWNDKPSDAQLGVVFNWLRWEMPTVEASDAVKWLEGHATKKEVSLEMNRLKKLKDSRKINHDSCFNSAIWEGYSYNV